jgi:hypothetical protein
LSASARNQPDAALPLVFALLLLTFPTVGTLIASRRPENPIGWIFCAVGLVFGIGVFAESYTSYTLHVSPGPLPGVQYAAWFSTWASFPIWFLAATMLYLLFPDGRLPSLQVLWRPLAWTAVISGAISALGEALASDTTNHASIANPLAVGGAVGSFLEMAAGFGTALLVLSCVASMASPVVRLRSGCAEISAWVDARSRLGIRAPGIASTQSLRAASSPRPPTAGASPSARA